MGEAHRTSNCALSYSDLKYESQERELGAIRNSYALAQEESKRRMKLIYHMEEHIEKIEAQNARLKGQWVKSHKQSASKPYRRQA